MRAGICCSSSGARGEDGRKFMELGESRFGGKMSVNDHGLTSREFSFEGRGATGMRGLGAAAPAVGGLDALGGSAAAGAGGGRLRGSQSGSAQGDLRGQTRRAADRVSA